MSYREIPFYEVPPNMIFWKEWDGKVDGRRVYAPHCYVKLENGKVRELREFGRDWTAEECGMHETDLMGTICQPLH